MYPFSIVTLLPLLMVSYAADRKAELLFSWAGFLRIPQSGLIVLALLLAMTAARHYSFRQFLGIQQILEGGAGKGMAASGKLDTSGVLGVVRHPLYLAVFIFLWARDLSPAGFIINLILSAYLVIGTLLEERKLVREFGEQYRRYQRQVSRFLPLRWLRAKLAGRS